MDHMTEKNNTLQVTGVLWDLGDLYGGPTDPAIEQDMTWCAEESRLISSKYGGTVAQLEAAPLFALVGRLEQLEERLGRISTFAYLSFAVATADSKVGALLQKVRELGALVGRETVFFELEWNAVPDERAAALCSDPILAPYHHYLSAMRRYAPHLLTQSEERLLLDLAPVGRGAWNILFEKVMGAMVFGEKKHSEEEVLAALHHPDRETRKQAAADLTAGLREHLHILTHIFNTLLAEKMISDRQRRYPHWASSMHLANEIEEQAVDILIEAVTSRYDIPSRYYSLKKQMLAVDTLYDYDRYAPLPHLPAREISWPQCREMVLDAFSSFSAELGRVGRLFFDRQWIHAPLLPGKRGGAFAHPCVPSVHPYLMVNYTGNIRDVSTVAHELGHGIHQYLAADQGYYNSDTTLVLAETASVFGELLLFHHLVELIDDERERTAFICQKLESIFATVFRQVSMNRFEHAVHTARREQGELGPDEISDYWVTTQRAMFMDSVTLTEDYGVWWSYIPHFLSTPGYVYSYAFGELLVLALYRRYQEQGPAFAGAYLELLAAGGSRTPQELLAPFSIELSDPSFWNGGLQVIDEMLRLVVDTQH